MLERVGFVGLGLFVIGTLSACTESLTLPGENPGPVSARAAAISERAALTELTHFVALALEDDQLRNQVWESLRASPYREGKLHFGRYLESTDGAGLRASVAERASLAGADLTDLLSKAPALEFYMPVPEHREAWKGDDGVVVATSLRDHELPVGFRPSGEEFTFRSAEVPPAVPVLALVPVETNFDALPEASVAYDCAGDAGDCQPMTSLARSSSNPGVYMTAAYIPDDHEGFLRGAPEFEVHLQVQQTSQDTAFDVRCAGNDAPDPTSRYDQNDDLWEGWVRVASLEEMNAFDALAPDSAIATFVVWEDDSDPCVLRDDSEHWTWWIGSFWVAATGAGWVVLAEDILQVLGGVIAFAAGVSKIEELLGGGDDIVGALTSSGCQIPGSATTDSTFTIYDFDDSSVEGCAALRGHPGPPSPLTVTITGDTLITSPGSYTWNAAPGGGAGSYTYQWEYCPWFTNCTPVGTASFYSRQVGSSDPSFQLKVTVSSPGWPDADDDHDVCVEIEGPSPC